MKSEENLQLIYVLKIGYNSRNEGQFEFIFSHDKYNGEFEDWCWHLSPAIDNCEPPTEKYVDGIFTLKTKAFDLFCLHEATDREYMHGYYNIHALAYETDREDIEENGFNQYEQIFEEETEDVTMLVFHYGMSFEQVKDLLYERKIILKDKEFVETSSIKLEEENNKSE